MHTDDYLFHDKSDGMLTRSQVKMKKTKSSLTILLTVSMLNTLDEGTCSPAASLPSRIWRWWMFPMISWLLGKGSAQGWFSSMVTKCVASLLEASSENMKFSYNILKAVKQFCSGTMWAIVCVKHGVTSWLCLCMSPTLEHATWLS